MVGDMRPREKREGAGCQSVARPPGGARRRPLVVGASRIIPLFTSIYNHLLAFTIIYRHWALGPALAQDREPPCAASG